MAKRNQQDPTVAMEAELAEVQEQTETTETETSTDANVGKVFLDLSRILPREQFFASLRVGRAMAAAGELDIVGTTDDDKAILRPEGEQLEQLLNHPKVRVDRVTAARALESAEDSVKFVGEKTHGRADLSEANELASQAREAYDERAFGSERDTANYGVVYDAAVRADTAADQANEAYLADAARQMAEELSMDVEGAITAELGKRTPSRRRNGLIGLIRELGEKGADNPTRPPGSHNPPPTTERGKRRRSRKQG